MAVSRGIGGREPFRPAIPGLGQLRRFGQYPEQITVRVQAGFLGRFDQAVDHRAAPGAQRRVGKQEVLPANHEGLDAPLCPVVAQLQPSVLQIAGEIRPLLLEVVLVAVRMEIAGKALQKLLRVLCLPVRLVLVEHDGWPTVPACEVQPHIALGLGLFPRLPQHLEGGLIGVEMSFFWQFSQA